jgi:branched-chain amino acid transport system substrate-binding protein
MRGGTAGAARLRPAHALRLCLAVCGVGAALGGSLSACGGVSPAANDTVGDQLTVYSSLPLQGPSGEISQQIVAGEKLALADAGGRVGSLTVSYVSLDDSNPHTGRWDPGVTAANARAAAQDPTTIAYIGDFNSGATAISLPLMNAAGILQVSPASPYVGLTSSLDAGQDEPERFYPTAVRTFGRLVPGDPVQAAAESKLLREMGVRRLYVLADEDQFDQPLAQLLAADARREGIALAGQGTLDTTPAEASFAGEAAKVAKARPDAVFFSGVADLGAARLFRQLHTALGAATLMAAASLSDPLFTAHLGAASAATIVGTPPGPYVLYGFEAMSVVLAAIRQAGRQGDDRRAVVRQFFATRDRRSVIGDYSVRPSGETTLTRYGAARIRAGQPVFWRALSG